jgi:large subunit ribosomal protein L25
MADTARSVLDVQPRSEKGKGPARRLRAKGLIPAVVYGQKREATHVAVDPAALEKAIATPHRFNTLLTLRADGTEKQVLFKEYEVDPVTRQLLHADFLEVDLSKPVRVDVPIVTTGKAEGVVEGGILVVSAHDVSVEALPGKIPVRIEVDVTPLKIGQSIHIAEVKAPEGVKIKYSSNFTLAVVTAPEKE